MNSENNLRVVVALTGASGAIYGIDLIARILSDCKGAKVYCAASEATKEIMQTELAIDDISKAVKIRLSQINAVCPHELKTRLFTYAPDDFNSPIASGSFHFDAMAISPCSMKTLGKCANSIADNIIIRAAEVALKERRRLVVVARETPLALTHLNNMRTLCQAGATILPASPAFYQNPQSIDDIVKFISARTMSAMGIRNDIIREWGDEK